MNRPPPYLADRMSGRSQSDFEPESDLSVAERADKFLRAREEASRLSGLMRGRGGENTRLGNSEELRKAQAILQATARHHAKSIRLDELERAQERGELKRETADLIREVHAKDTRDRTRELRRKR